MQYGIKNLMPIVQLKELAEKFRKENNGFVYDQFPERILELLAFHKHDKYNAENEVRFFFKEVKDLYGNHHLETIYKDINSRNEVKHFFKTFLVERKAVLENEIGDKNVSDEYFEHYPTFQIEKIILGNNISNRQKSEVVNFLNALKNKFNYSFVLGHLNNENEILTPY